MSGEDDGELKRKYLKWSGELQDAYLDALEQCGGLQEARPKALLDILSPRFPFLTLQAVKNHLQKQRTKEAKAGGAAGASGTRGSRAPPSLGAEGSEDVDQMMASDEAGAPAAATAAAAAAAGVSSRPRGASPGMPAAAPPTAGAAAAAPPAAVGSGAGAGAGAGPALPTGWTAPLSGASGVQPDSLMELARRALALTVHQLGLYRKLLEELELNERDHAALVAALREDPTGRSVVLEAARAASSGAAAGAAHSSGTAGGSGASSAAEEGRPARLRRLVARLLPPNPFSSGPRAEASLKLTAWIASVSGEQHGEPMDAASLSAGSQLGAAPDLLHGLLQATRAASAPAGVPPGVAAALLGALPCASGGHQPAAATGDVRRADEAGDEAMQVEREQHGQRRKRHKPLSELLAEIPLQEPAAAERLAMQHTVPTPSELQQLLGGVLPGSAPAAPTAAVGAAAPDAATAAADSPLGPALSLLLQQHLGGAPGVAQQAQHDGMDLDDDALMLRALDAQMSSLLLQSVSNALMRSAAEGDHAVEAAGGAGQQAAAAGLGSLAAAPASFEAPAAVSPAGAMPELAGFQAAAAGLLQGDEPLSAGALDISVLQSFLDMLSSGGLGSLAPGGAPQPPGQAGAGAAGASAAVGPALDGLLGGLPLGEANMSGSSGSHGSAGRLVGGAFSAFHLPGSGGGQAGQ